MVELAATIFADGPSSNPSQPMKPLIRDWGTWLEQTVLAFTSGAGNILKTSRAALFADLAHAADTTAWVMGDPTVAYNGIYVKSGASGTGSWTRVSDLPFSFIIASDVGAGTPNAIQATTSIPVSGSALVWSNVFEANTSSPVTISFNGGSPLTIKTNTGNDVVAGGLVAGMIVMGIVSGSTFRILNDQVSSAIVAAAEAAQAAAEAAAASVLAYTKNVQNSVTAYSSPDGGGADVYATWTNALAARTHVVVPYDDLDYNLNNTLIVPAGKILELQGGAEVAYGASGNLVLGDNAGYIAKGFGSRAWVHARNRAGAVTPGPYADAVGYEGAAFDYWVTSDTMDVGSDFSRGINAHHVFGGSSVKGGRAAIIGQLYHQHGASAASNPNRNYCGVIGDVHAQVDDGGTGVTLANALGVYFGLAGHSYSTVVGGNHLGLVGCELNTSNVTGSTQAYIATLTLASRNAARGVVADAALMISAISPGDTGFGPHAGYRHGILFTDLNGSEPFAADSTLIGWHWTAGGARVVETGIDLAGFSFLGNVIQGQRFAAGETFIRLGDNAGIAEIDAKTNAESSTVSLRLKTKGNGDVLLVTEGTGNLRLPTQYVAASFTPSGYITVKDVNGGSYRLACVPA